MHGDKLNPNIVRGVGETSDSYARRIGEFLSRIEWQSGGHILWYTHKNPAGCWICELLQIARTLRDEALAEHDDEGTDECEYSEYNIDDGEPK